MEGRAARWGQRLMEAERRRLKGKTALASAIPDIAQPDDHFIDVKRFLYKALRGVIRIGDDDNGLSDSGDQESLLSHFVWGRLEAMTAEEDREEDGEGSFGEEEQDSEGASICSEYEYEYGEGGSEE